MQAEQLVADGKLDEALEDLKAQVRDNPADAKLRVFLFQLLCVTGDWDRALTQLNVAGDMDSMNHLMAQMCRPALQCEALRREVFSGKRTPMVFGEPEHWVGLLVQANALIAEGHESQAAELRAQALEQAPAIGGRVNGTDAFEWIADGDDRLGPVMEIVINGKYYWVPMNHISSIYIEEPTDLRDLVWSPAQITWSNGGDCVGIIPTRYPGSELSDDNAIRMARKTDWIERDGGIYIGLGQRMFTTDQGEYPILEIRSLEWGEPEASTDGAAEIQAESQSSNE